MNAEIARDYLEDVVAKKRAIPYQRRSRKGRGGVIWREFATCVRFHMTYVFVRR